MKEIEVKAKVRDQAALQAAIEELDIKLSPPIEQNDIIYALDIERFGVFTPNINILRVRRQGDQNFFTLKSSQTNELESIEYESEVTKPEEIEAIIKRLGFKEGVRVNKIRRKAKYQDMEICLDEVKNLGTFVEVEKLVEDGEPETIQRQLFSFLESLGVQAEDEVTQGYDTLMFLKGKNDNE